MARNRFDDEDDLDEEQGHRKKSRRDKLPTKSTRINSQYDDERFNEFYDESDRIEQRKKR